MDKIDLNLQDKIKESQVKEAVKGFILDDNTIDKLKTTFETQLELGLKDSLNISCLQMENTYVPEMTNGQEQGSYLALDLGGTNFRVMLLDMSKGKIVKEVVEYYTVQEATRLGDELTLCQTHFYAIVVFKSIFTKCLCIFMDEFFFIRNIRGFQ